MTKSHNSQLSAKYSQRKNMLLEIMVMVKDIRILQKAVFTIVSEIFSAIKFTWRAKVS